MALGPVFNGRSSGHVSMSERGCPQCEGDTGIYDVSYRFDKGTVTKEDIMKLKCFLVVFGAVVCGVSGQDLKDVKFYNLEKEYRQTETYVYKVKSAKALELKQIVGDMLSIYGSLYVNEETNELYITDVPEKISDVKVVVEKLDIEGIKAGNNLSSKIVYLKHENVSELSSIIRHKLSVDGTLFEVPYLNAVAITDVPSKIQEVESLVALLDVPGPHIAIEITVVEFNDERFSSLGINVFNWLQGLSVRGDFHADGISSLDKSGTAISVRPRTEPPLTKQENIRADDLNNNFHLSSELRVGDLVGFICENGDGTILANTRIVTRNNKEATISATEVIPYRFYENESAEIDRNVRQESAGIYLRVRPTIQQDSLINLAIFPIISDLTGWSPKGMPIIFQRMLSTEVKVKDNSVFVLGGLKKKENVEVRRGVPGLKDVPVLQYLFSIKQKITVERELLIFIRPTTGVSTELSSGQIDNLMKRYEERSRKAGPRNKRRGMRAKEKPVLESGRE